MKIIDAYWEKRNLGVDVVEFEIEHGDSLASIDEILSNEKGYNVVKIPSAMPGLLIPIQQSGYLYIESSIKIVLPLKNFRLPPEWERFTDGVINQRMDDDDINRCFAEIESGMFNTDRIYRDPQFGAKQSATRYINWIKDEIERGSLLYKFVYDGRTVGFYIIKDEGNGIYNCALGGVYSQWLSSPLAVNLVYQHVQESKRLGFKKFVSHLSSNNSRSFRLQTACGCDICDVLHVFVKHKKQEAV